MVNFNDRWQQQNYLLPKTQDNRKTKIKILKKTSFILTEWTLMTIVKFSTHKKILLRTSLIPPPPLLFNLNLIFGVLLKYKNQMEALIFFSSFRFTHPYGININLLGKALTDARARQYLDRVKNHQWGPKCCVCKLAKRDQAHSRKLLFDCCANHVIHLLLLKSSH